MEKVFISIVEITGEPAKKLKIIFTITPRHTSTYPWDAEIYDRANQPHKMAKLSLSTSPQGFFARSTKI
jgi:hypothetical protein